MDERTNRRRLARLCLPAKAGATKKLVSRTDFFISLNLVGWLFRA